jgi:hypothetical protein
MIAQGAIAGVFLGGLLVLSIQGVPRATPYAPTNAREAWAVDFLAELGNAEPTPATVAFVVAWQTEEGTSARNNPLATSQDWEGATLFNSHGVKEYASYQDGIKATVRTLQYSYTGYADILEGLRTNDPDRALAGLGSSPWAAEAGYGARVRELWRMEETRRGYAQPVSLPNNVVQATGAAYLLQGDVGENVRAALNANGGALQSFEIQPGETWSFGHSIAPISALGSLPVVCGPAGCYAGGGWCDLSALYVKVADGLGLVSSFPPHAGVNDTRFPGILLDEWGGGGDLTITNTQAAPVIFRAYAEGNTLIVEGGFLP